MDAFETKTQEAAKLVRDTLAAGAGVAVAFGGGVDSMVLLHMVRTASGGKIVCPVVGFDPPGHLFSLYPFTSKIQTLWCFRLDRIDWTEVAEESGTAYPVFALLARPCRARGLRRVFTGLRSEESDIALDKSVEVDGISFVNPLLDFSASDSGKYIRRFAVPSCSLYQVNKKLGCFPFGGDPLRGTCDVPVHPMDAEEEEDDVKARLKALGYM
jgi:3'-phosphoadenosine 5'-phosphosulfate sulfotransferase (PAPS reductase)/FAD synthetase